MTDNYYKLDTKNLYNSEGPLLQKQLILKTTIDQLESCTVVHGVTKAEDQLIKFIHEYRAKLADECAEFGLVEMK